MCVENTVKVSEELDKNCGRDTVCKRGGKEAQVVLASSRRWPDLFWNVSEWSNSLNKSSSLSIIEAILGVSENFGAVSSCLAVLRGRCRIAIALVPLPAARSVRKAPAEITAVGMSVDAVEERRTIAGGQEFLDGDSRRLSALQKSSIEAAEFGYAHGGGGGVSTCAEEQLYFL